MNEVFMTRYIIKEYGCTHPVNVRYVFLVINFRQCPTTKFVCSIFKWDVYYLMTRSDYYRPANATWARSAKLPERTRDSSCRPSCYWQIYAVQSSSSAPNPEIDVISTTFLKNVLKSITDLCTISLIHFALNVYYFSDNQTD